MHSLHTPTQSWQDFESVKITYVGELWVLMGFNYDPFSSLMYQKTQVANTPFDHKVEASEHIVLQMLNES